ncbi:hypothetical protein Chor_008290 [Crotalus horridus]
MAGAQELPDDILLAIFYLLPINELIQNCRLVCSRWRDVVDSPFLWKRKYQQDDAALRMPKTFYIFCHMEKNLIKNPCGDEGLDFWDTATPSSGQWKVKDVFEKDSARIQAWDFLQRNIYIKDEYIPYQDVEKCFAAYNGFYSSFNSHYTFCVKLLSEDFQVIREYHSKNKYKYDSEYDGEWRQHQGQHFNWQQSSCGTKLMKCLRMAKERGKSKRMRITKTSVTVGPFSLDKAMHNRHGRDIRHCHYSECPCRGNLIHWSVSKRSLSVRC